MKGKRDCLLRKKSEDEWERDPFFESVHGVVEIAQGAFSVEFTIEELYQAFKRRLMREMADAPTTEQE